MIENPITFQDVNLSDRNGSMSLREYYAGVAIQGLAFANAGQMPSRHLAQWAVELADVLIDELNKTKKEFK